MGEWVEKGSGGRRAHGQRGSSQSPQLRSGSGQLEKGWSDFGGPKRRSRSRADSDQGRRRSGQGMMGRGGVRGDAAVGAGNRRETTSRRRIWGWPQLCLACPTGEREGEKEAAMATYQGRGTGGDGMSRAGDGGVHRRRRTQATPTQRRQRRRRPACAGR
jgi:hypothetical protein